MNNKILFGIIAVAFVGGLFSAAYAGPILPKITLAGDVDVLGNLATDGPIQTGSTITPPVAYNRMGTGTALGSQINNPNDLFVSDDLQVANDMVVGDDLVVNDELRIGPGNPDNDDVILFDDNTQNLFWDNSEDRFEFSNDLNVQGLVTCDGCEEPYVPFILTNPNRIDCDDADVAGHSPGNINLEIDSSDDIIVEGIVLSAFGLPKENPGGFDSLKASITIEPIAGLIFNSVELLPPAVGGRLVVDVLGTFSRENPFGFDFFTESLGIKGSELLEVDLFCDAGNLTSNPTSRDIDFEADHIRVFGMKKASDTVTLNIIVTHT